MIKRPGCLVLLIIFVALLIAGLLIGAIGSSLLHLKVPNFLAVDKPHVELPAEGVFHISSFTVTNTLIASWLTIIVLGLLFYFATRKMKLVPGGFQNFAEWIVEYLLNLVTGVAGEKNARTIFPLMATIFIYVITNALLALLLPIFGTIGIYEHGGVFVPILRAANTDINLPLSIAIISVVCVEFWGLRSLGFFRYSKNFFDLGPLRDGFVSLFKGKIKPAFSGILFGFINIFVGLIEVLSHLIRIVSFTFRLFGNMVAGEILILVITFLIPFSAAIIFYFFEFIFGFAQALIFSGLTLVFGVIAMASHGEEPEHAN